MIYILIPNPLFDLRPSQRAFSKFILFTSWKIDFVLANDADYD